MCSKESNFIFHGVRTECVQNRFIESWVDKERGLLKIKEFFLSTNMTLSDDISTIHDFDLPENLRSERIIGRPICIGCRDSLLILQYITQSVRYIRFIAVHMTAKCVQCFEDTTHFFTRDFSAINVLRCHISPDKLTILLRLPQDIATPKRWTQILNVKKHFPCQSVSSDNLLLGTEKYKIRDRRFHCVMFQHNGDILTADIEQYCSRCRFNIISSESGKSLSQKMHRMDVRSVTISGSDAYNSDSDSDNEQEYFLIDQCSLSYNRKGDILVLYCLGQTNLGVPRCRLFFYNSQTLKNIFSEDLELAKKGFQKDRASVTLAFTPCDTKVQIWIFNRGASSFVVGKEIALPSCTNSLDKLKEICRCVLLKSYNLKYIQALQLPPSLINYLLFKDQIISSFKL